MISKQEAYEVSASYVPPTGEVDVSGLQRVEQKPAKPRRTVHGYLQKKGDKVSREILVRLFGKDGLHQLKSLVAAGKIVTYTRRNKVFYKVQ